MYYLVKHGCIRGRFVNLIDIAIFLGVKVERQGSPDGDVFFIYYNGKKDTVSYTAGSWKIEYASVMRQKVMGVFLAVKTRSLGVRLLTACYRQYLSIILCITIVFIFIDIRLIITASVPVNVQKSFTRLATTKKNHG